MKSFKRFLQHSLLGLTLLFPNLTSAGTILTDKQEEAVNHLRQLEFEKRDATFIEIEPSNKTKKELDDLIALFYEPVMVNLKLGIIEKRQVPVNKSDFISYTIQSRDLLPLCTTLNKDGFVDVLVDRETSPDLLFSYSVKGNEIQLEAYVQGKARDLELDVPLFEKTQQVYSFEPKKLLINISDKDKREFWKPKQPNAYALNDSLIYNTIDLANYVAYDLVFISNSGIPTKFDTRLDDTTLWRLCAKERLNISLPDITQRMRRSIAIHETTHAYVYGWEDPRVIEQTHTQAEEVAMLTSLYDDPDTGLLALFLNLSSDELKNTYKDEPNACAASYILENMATYFDKDSLEDLIYLEDEKIQEFAKHMFVHEHQNFFENFYPLQLVERTHFTRRIDPEDWGSFDRKTIKLDSNDETKDALKNLLDELVINTPDSEELTEYLEDKENLEWFEPLLEQEGIFYVLLDGEGDEDYLAIITSDQDKWEHGLFASVEIKEVNEHIDLFDKDVRSYDLSNLYLLNPYPIDLGYYVLVDGFNAFALTSDLTINVEGLSTEVAKEVVWYRDNDFYLNELSFLFSDPVPGSREYLQEYAKGDKSEITERFVDTVSQHEATHLLTMASGVDPNKSEFTTYVDEELGIMSQIFADPGIGLPAVYVSLGYSGLNAYYSGLEPHQSAIIFLTEEMGDYFRLQGMEMEELSDLYNLNPEQVQEFLQHHYDETYKDYFDGNSEEVNIEYLPLDYVSEKVDPAYNIIIVVPTNEEGEESDPEPYFSKD
ncbi:MAG: hypothetical protein ABIF40_04485 [archaeon]